ncbi:MAG: ATP-dependent DNA ligase [Candidatus Dormibacteria bacterium]
MAAFAQTADGIAATRSKLAKVDLLASYLRGLDRVRLPLAARYFAGRIFPNADGRILSVGGSALGTVIRELTGAEDGDISASWARHADVGDTVADLLQQSGLGSEGVDILDVDAAFSEMAATRATRGRVDLLLELLRRCSAVEARYVTKLISGELRIGLREGLVEEAIGHAFGRPAVDVARADMHAGDLGDVAVLALDDRLGEAAPQLFAPLRFMLASPVADADEAVRRLGDSVWVEDKYDGIRCQLHRDGNRVALFSRDLKDITDQFPEVVVAAGGLPRSMILDGEILAFRDGRVMPFAALQRRLGRRAPSLAMQAEVPVIHVAWDLLWDDGDTILDVPLRDRRARLDALALGGGLATAHLEQAVGAAGIEQLFLDARARLNEGLLLKDPASPYLPGRRGLYWLKLKRPLDTLDCVVVGAEWGHGKRRAVLSDVTFAVRRDEDGELVNVGKAYTGLSDAEIAEMTGLLHELTMSVHGRYLAVRPEIVLEIAFDAIQESRRHRSGYAMRFPRIVRWRHDKSVVDISSLAEVQALSAARQHGRDLLVDQATSTP